MSALIKIQYINLVKVYNYQFMTKRETYYDKTLYSFQKIKQDSLQENRQFYN